MQTIARNPNVESRTLIATHTFFCIIFLWKKPVLDNTPGLTTIFP